MRAAVLILALVVSACGGGGDAAPPSADVRADAQALQQILGEDPARLVLEEVDVAIREERPVLASQIIDSAAIPATRRQIERLEQAPAASQQGRTLRARAVRLHRARLRALEQWRDALATTVEDDALVEALHASADAEREIVELYDELERIRPLAEGAREAAADEERQRALGGLPSLEEDALRDGRTERTAAQAAGTVEGTHAGEPPEHPLEAPGEPQEPLSETEDPPEGHR